MNIPTWLRAAVWAAAGLMAGRAFAADGPADTAATLRQAVRERRVVEFAYNGHSRTVEPHALGRGAEENAVLLGWQTGGGSQSEPPPGWRVFSLAEIRNLKLSEKTFAKPRPDYQARKAGRGLTAITDEIAAE